MQAAAATGTAVLELAAPSAADDRASAVWAAQQQRFISRLARDEAVVSEWIATVREGRDHTAPLAPTAAPGVSLRVAIPRALRQLEAKLKEARAHADEGEVLEVRKREALKALQVHHDLQADLQRRFQEALTEAQRHQKAAARQRREELLQLPDGSRAGVAAVADTAAERAATLQRTASIVQDEVERSAAALEKLRAGRATLLAVHTEHSGLRGTLATTRSLINTLVRRGQTDRVLVWGAFCVLLLAVAYVVKKRLGPWIWWLVPGW